MFVVPIAAIDGHPAVGFPVLTHIHLPQGPCHVEGAHRNIDCWFEPCFVRSAQFGMMICNIFIMSN
jgi:hypothetical protein